MLRIGFRTLAAGIAAVAFASGAYAQSTVRVASFTTPQGATIQKVLQPWMDAVEKEVGDDVDLQGFWGGALGRDPSKQLDLVVNGVSDVAFIVPSYTIAKFPEMSIFALPYLFRTGDEASIAAWRMYEKGLLSGLDGIHPITIYASDNNSLHLAKPIKSVDEIKGMKIRTAGPQESGIIEIYGATPIGMGMPAVTESISRGVIDGTLQSWTGVKSFRVFNVTKGHVEEPLGTLSFIIAMNKEAYRSLPENVRAAIDKHGGLELARRGGQGFDEESAAFSKKMRQDSSRSFITFTGEAAEKRAKLFQPLHEEWIKSTPNGEQVYEALTAILADIRAGR